jgi:hypothetical protein
MNADAIYFDNNATTPPDPRVLDEMHAAFRTAFANPGSQHSFGRSARRVLEDSREQIAEILDAVRTDFHQWRHRITQHGYSRFYVRTSGLHWVDRR